MLIEREISIASGNLKLSLQVRERKTFDVLRANWVLTSQDSKFDFN